MQNQVKIPLPEIEFKDGAFTVRRYDVSNDAWVTDVDAGDLSAFDDYIRRYCDDLANSLVRWAGKRAV